MTIRHTCADCKVWWESSSPIREGEKCLICSTKPKDKPSKMPAGKRVTGLKGT